ncbi:UPF0118 membrane protein [Synergistales bacterium]|nr:UPF0118 membrane protein [Synergistales bacterium]
MRIDVSYRTIEACAVIVTVVVVFFILGKAAAIAIPFLLALILAMFFAPIMKLGVRHGIQPPITMLAILIGLVLVFVPLIFFAHYAVNEMLAILPGYYNKLVGIGQSLLESAHLPKEFWNSINWYNTIGRYASGMTGVMYSFFSKFVMTIVFLVFMLIESPYIKDHIALAFQSERGERVAAMSEKIISQISRYLATLAVISLVTGLCVGAALTFIGVDFAVIWGALAFILNFIPTIGSIIASIPPVLVALVQFYPDWVPCAMSFAAVLMIQFTIGNIMTPKIMGDTLGLSPVVILVSLMFWGSAWGIVGALLSVPIAAVLKIICENIPRLRFAAILMSSSKDSANRGNREKDNDKN